MEYLHARPKFTREETLTELNTHGWLQALPVDIRLGRRATTLSYYNTAKNTAVKSFIVQRPVR